MIALLVPVLAALVAGPLAIWMKGRYDKRNTDNATEATAQASAENARTTLAQVTETRVEHLFTEYDRLRKAYRSDIDDLRGQLRESNDRMRESNDRIRLLEHEVAEWRSGMHGVVGVWVAVPASVWEFVRSQLPALPPTRFPGEVDAEQQ